MDDDAKEIFALDWSADLLMILNALGYVGLDLLEGGADVEITGDAIDEQAFRIEDEDGDFEVGMNFAVGGAKKGDAGGTDGVADAVAAEGSVCFVDENVAGSGSVFSLRGRAGG